MEREQQREEGLRVRLRSLDDSQRKEVFRRFNRCLKDADSYAVLNYVFIAGLHHFYLGKWARGLVNIAIFWVAVGLMLAGSIVAGLIILLAITVFELRELFQSQVIVLAYNNDQLERLLDELGGTRNTARP